MPGVADFANIDTTTRTDQATVTVRVPDSAFTAIDNLAMPKWLDALIGLIPSPVRNTIFNVIGGDPLDKFKGDLRGQLNALNNEIFSKHPIVIPYPKLPGVPNPPTGEPPAVPDPLSVLKQLAESINAAEQELNKFNLLIASGSVNATLVVGIGPAAATATVNLTIAPRQVA